MRSFVSSLALVAMLFGSTANADDIIVEYTTAGSTTSLAAGQADANVAADNLDAGSGLNVQTFSTFNFTGWDTASTTFEQAVAANDFWSWGFDVTAAGAVISLTEMNIRLDRSGSGPDDFEIRGSVNGGAAVTLLTHDYNDSSSGVTFTDVDISALGTVSTGDSVEFVLAAFNSESAAGSFDLETVTFPGGTDSLQILGNVSVVPEPSSAIVLAAGALVLMRRRR